jgi:glycosyltransferase involved in cell wall biosynthesis
MNNTPLKISIITICKNVESVIERTLFSVAEQTCCNIDYIVIDGGSMDATLEKVARYRSHIVHLISEPDSGIYEAMNKGIALARGEFCLFLNAGDYLCHASAIANAAAQMNQADENIDVIYGNQLLYHQSTGAARVWRPKKRTTLDFYSGSLPHAATFIRRAAFSRAGLYDTSYRIAGDYEWFVRAFSKFHLRFRHIDVLISVFIEGEGISTRQSGKSLQIAEKQRVRDHHFHGAQGSLLKAGLFLRKNKLI